LSPVNLAPLPPGDETPGQRLSRIRRERGFTQIELAEKTGLVQTLVSDYERGKLRLNADMILRLSTALEVSTDDLLQPAGSRNPKITSRKVLRRLERMEALHPAQQTVLLRTIDTFLEGAAAQAARRV
jgi:transcriptional regulator with XRE-family HTH domain